MKYKNIVVYVDGVDYEHEIGEASDGNKIFPSIKALQENNRCWEGCGVVKCELVFKEWVIESDYSEMFKNSKQYSLKDIQENPEIIRLESAKKRLTYLEGLVAGAKAEIKVRKKLVDKTKEKKNVVE
jgi:hypothetical protein